MIEYVESNFPLEIALSREGAEDALAMLDAAESGQLEIAIPTFALCEPYGTVSYRARKRSDDFKGAERQLNDLSRGEAHLELVAAMAPRLVDVIEIATRERNLLEEVIGRILGSARLLPFDWDAYDSAKAHRVAHGLDASDALIYGAVLLDAHSSEGEKRFTTRNINDFDRPEIRRELREAGCELRFVFGT